MPSFDAYVMIDWSGGDRRRGGRPDCLWIAYGKAGASRPRTISPAARSEAEAAVRAILLGTGGRVLVCADFAYGYPAGFAALLAPAAAGAPGWRSTWRHLQRELRDDLGTPPGGLATNRSNRFEVAAAVNASAMLTAPGPFWCHFAAGRSPHIPQRRPDQPFRARDAAGDPVLLEALRLTDRLAGADTAFRLFGTGSVGSQALTGIPRIAALRFDAALQACSAVWPFETGWSEPGRPWPPPGVRVLHAEIYPSLRTPRRDAIKDRGQVRALWHWARDLDAVDGLAPQFARPVGITKGSRIETGILGEEGWILGCPGAAAPRFRPAAAGRPRSARPARPG
jgi:hypothetical protein